MGSDYTKKLLRKDLSKRDDLYQIDEEHNTVEFASKEKLAAFKKGKLKQALRYAYDHSKWHREQMHNLHIHPDQIETVEDLRNLPVMNKRVLMSHWDEINTEPSLNFKMVQDYLSRRDNIDEDPVPGYRIVSTGGTTGNPGYFAYNDQELLYIRAQWLRALRAVDNVTGLSKEKSLRRAMIIMTGAHLIGYKARKDWLPNQTLVIPVLTNGQPTKISHIAKQLTDFQPHILQCFGSTLRMVAEYKLQKGEDFPYSPVVIISTAATLDSSTKRLVNKAWPDSKIFDMYSSTDMGGIGFTCEKGRMHLNTDYFELEIIDHQGNPVRPGEMGKVTFTSYWHRTLPLIRYQLEDVVSISDKPCLCGRSLPVVEQLFGRENTICYRWEEGKVSPIPQGAIMDVMETIEGLKNFQLIQNNLTSVTLKTVVNNPTQEIKDKIRQSIQKLFGPKTTVNLEFVNYLGPDPRSGKYLPVRREFDPYSAGGVDHDRS